MEKIKVSLLLIKELIINNFLRTYHIHINVLSLNFRRSRYAQSSKLLRLRLNCVDETSYIFN